MIHTIYTLSTRQYSIIEETKNNDLIRRKWNIFPNRWFKKGINQFYTDFNRIFNGGDDTKALIKDKNNIKDYNEILQLNAMYSASKLIMDAQNQHVVESLLNGEVPGVIESNLNIYVEKIQKITDINILEEKGLERLYNEIQRLVDKYSESNPKKPKEEPKKSAPFTDLAQSYAHVCDENFNPELTIYEVSRMKVRAEHIIRKQNDGAKK